MDCETACPLDNGYSVAELPLDCAECMKDTAGDWRCHEYLDNQMQDRLDGEK